jgi:hypothetical protein
MMVDDFVQMRALLERLRSTVHNLDFSLSVAQKKDFVHEELLEDINFDVQDILMFSRAVRDSWRNTYDG